MDANNSFQAMYDGENRQISVTAKVIGASVTTVYRYDGDGKRVQKVSSSGVTYVYDAAGQLSAEYVSDRSNPDTGTQYLSTDHLGSTRAIVTMASGVVTQVSKSDYLPFGQEIPPTWGARSGYQPDASETMKLTGKERDAETGLDYFGARYFSGAQGRFIGPDAKQITKRHIISPQKWNRYAYVRNNPLVSVDLDGLDDYFIFRREAEVGSSVNWANVNVGSQNNLKVFNGPEANLKNLTMALGTKDAHVLIVGHTVHDENAKSVGFQMQDVSVGTLASGRSEFLPNPEGPGAPPILSINNFAAGRRTEYIGCVGIDLRVQ